MSVHKLVPLCVFLAGVVTLVIMVMIRSHMIENRGYDYMSRQKARVHSRTAAQGQQPSLRLGTRSGAPA